MRNYLLLSGAFLLLPTAVNATEIWVGCYTGDNIVRFDASSGNNLGTVGVGKLDGVLGITGGSDGSVYVASELTGSIERFSSNGTWLNRYATANTPTGITFDSTGRGYVAQFDTDSVTRFSSGGTLLGNFVAPGSGGLNGPDLGITFGPDGHLYVPSFWTGDILRYNGTTGAFMDKFIAASSGLTQPRQILWRDGKVYVTSDNGNKVLRYNAATGAFLDTFVTSGSGGLNGASGMVFSGDSLYIASWRNNRVLRYDANTGAFQSSFATTGINGPVSLAAVPEPASIAAVGGGLALLLRRRKKG